MILREALGIGSSGPPPWQKKMVHMGYPAAWLAPHPTQITGDPAVLLLCPCCGRYNQDHYDEGFPCEVFAASSLSVS